MSEQVLVALDGPRHGPGPGKTAKQLVVLLHGWGADGDDLIGLAPQLSQALPDAAFVSPHAPEICEANPYGKQWFSLEERNPEALYQGARTAAENLNGFLDQELSNLGLDDSQLALVGFSQGTMLALHVAVRRPKQMAAVVGFSGLLIGGERLEEELVSKPSTLLIHGDQDPVVPFAAMAEAAGKLGLLGVPVIAHGCKGLAHGIDGQGLSLCARHLMTTLLTS